MKEWIALGLFLIVLVALAWWNGKASTKHPTFGDDQARTYRKRGGTTL